MDTPSSTGPGLDASAGASPYDPLPGSVTELAEALAEQYAVERQLGRGGMATVYLARDRKHDRPVAVKVLHPEFAASIGAERFLREIRVAATLQHPHVLGLHDSGSAAGLLYYAMPYVEGESLRQRLRRAQQLPLAEALQIAAEVADALAYAHGRGIVHRDIKPENILLSNGHAVVADFGIARAADVAGGDKLTETGMALGTPHYMSPEQGTGGDVGPSSDVYALGCVLYEMLVGEPPFTGPNPQAVIARHALAEIPSPRVIRPAIPAEVEQLVTRALAKLPADRWPDATSLEQAIRGALATAIASQPSGAQPFGTPQPRPAVTLPTRAPVGGVAVATRRRPVARVAALVAAGAVAVAAGATYLVRGQPGRTAAASADADARHVAVLYLETHPADSALAPVADGLTESLTEGLRAVPGLAVVSSNGVAPFRGAGVPVDSVARALTVGTLVTGRLERDAGDRLRVTLTLRDASGAAFADTSFTRPAADVIALRADVIDRSATLVRRRLGDEIALRASRLGTTSGAAWTLVQRGLLAQRRAQAAFAAGDADATARADAAADSLLALAEAADPAWHEPPLRRAWLAFRQARRRTSDAAYVTPFAERGLAAAERSLARDSSASALEVRGSLRYLSYLLGIGFADRAAEERLVGAAQADLERAVAIDPAAAEAWSTLSHLYVNRKSLVDAKLAATKAYEMDTYVTGADGLVWRLYEVSYTLAQFQDARRYCAELGRRFPASPRHAECRLWLLSVPDAPPPSPAQAWELAAEREAGSPAQRRDYVRLDDHVAVAAALARAGLADSARRVLAVALADPTADPRATLRLSAAWVHSLLGENDRAIAALKEWYAANGLDGRRTLANNNWWWRDLQRDPRFRQLLGT